MCRRRVCSQNLGRSHLERAALADLYRVVVDKTPSSYGVGGEAWTANRLAAAIGKLQGARPDAATVSRLLARAGIRTTYEGAAVAAEEALKDWVVTRLPVAVRSHLKGVYELVFLDAVTAAWPAQSTGKKPTVNLLSARGSRNRLWFTCRTGRLTDEPLTALLRDVYAEVGRPVRAVVAVRALALPPFVPNEEGTRNIAVFDELPVGPSASSVTLRVRAALDAVTRGDGEQGHGLPRATERGIRRALGWA
jgi:hypothetical protein